MAKQAQKRPTGGRSRKGNYQTVVMRVPVQIQKDVERLIDAFHAENEVYEALPITGSFWAVLGVPPGSSAEVVRESYRRLAKLYHPDTNKRTDAAIRFNALTKAYKAFQESQNK
jgi:DnaJ domain